MRHTDARAWSDRLRRAHGVLVAGALLLLALAGTLAHGRYATGQGAARLEELRTLTARLGLTDLALFTEARYTRHPTQADLHSAFQDHPGAFEHFPSGALLGPPPRLRHHNDHGRLDRAAAVPD